MNSNDHVCLICRQVMQFHKGIEHTDYYCGKNDNHHFCYRIVKEDLFIEINNDWSFSEINKTKMIKLRIRLLDEDGAAIRLKIHYDKGYSEVWKIANSTDRVIINSIVIPDFNDMIKLKNKMKTFLVFG